MEDLYSILEISRMASQEEIKSKYRELAFKYHPDRNPNDPKAEERFKKINYSYSVLGNPEKRKRYDLGMEDDQYESDDFASYSSARARDFFFKTILEYAIYLTMNNVSQQEIMEELIANGCPEIVAAEISKIVESRRKEIVRESARKLMAKAGINLFLGIALSAMFNFAGIGIIFKGLILYGFINLNRALYYLYTGKVPRSREEKNAWERARINQRTKFSKAPDKKDYQDNIEENESNHAAYAYIAFFVALVIGIAIFAATSKESSSSMKAPVINQQIAQTNDGNYQNAAISVPAIEKQKTPSTAEKEKSSSAVKDSGSDKSVTDESIGSSQKIIEGKVENIEKTERLPEPESKTLKPADASGTFFALGSTAVKGSGSDKSVTDESIGSSQKIIEGKVENIEKTERLPEPESKTLKPADASGTFFTLGSTKEEVIKAMGTPNGINVYKALDKEEWHYSYSTVTFNNEGVVIGWDDSSRVLRLR